MEQISYSQCLKEMFALGRFGIKLELDTTAGILQRIGEPEKKFCSIHIAGTNGKGSIASYIASILQCSGFKVGLYTSPHLIKFNERFCINGEMVLDEDIVEAYLAVKKADTGYRKATFFEISTAMAFYLFAKYSVDWAVIETGMGGRLDATNVIKPAVTVISNISLEHTEYLGDTIEKIAAEKGGIIKPDIPIITGVKEEPAISVIKSIAKEKSAPLYQYGKDFSAANPKIDNQEILQNAANPKTENQDMLQNDIGTQFIYKGINVVWNDMKTNLLGEHQIDNSAIALAVCELLTEHYKSIDLKENRVTKTIENVYLKDSALIKKDNLLKSECIITEDTVRKGLANTKWAGRLEYILKKPLVIIDGAHNLDAANNLGNYLKKHEKLTLIIGILSDKPYKEMLSYLLPHADNIIFTKAKIDRSLEPDVLKDFAQTIVDHDKIKIIEDVAQAVEYAVKNASQEDCVCIAGSLYVAGEARDKILKDFVIAS